MTDKETAKIMAVLQVAYPRYYRGISDDEARRTVTLWDSMLKDYSYDLVSKAVKALIATEKFVPTIADVIEKIQLITKPEQMSEIEAWGLVRKAIRNGTYHAKEEFDKLPIDIQNAIGNFETIREWAMTELEGFEKVIGSNFMRSYRAKVEQTKKQMALPADVKEFMRIAAGSHDMNLVIENKEEIE